MDYISAFNSTGSQINELFYLKLGSIWTLDSLYLCFLLPLALTGFVLNSLSFLAFLKIHFSKQMLKTYFSTYSLTSLTICLLVCFYAFSRIPRFSDISLSPFFSFCRCKIISFCLTFQFFLNVLDCIILGERCSNFNRHFDPFFRINSHVICLVVLLACSIINLPIFFDLSPRPEPEFQQALTNLTFLDSFSYCSTGQFMSSLYGKITNFIVIFVRDILTLLAEIAISVYSIVLFKQFLNKRALESTINACEVNRENGIDSYDVIQVASPSTYAQNTAVSDLNSFNTKLTKMTLYMSLCSILTHTGYLLVFLIYGPNNNSILSHIMTLVALAITLVKHVSNFFLFFFFNKNFRQYIKNFGRQIQSAYESTSSLVSFVLFGWILDRILD
jgi:hypothetical protein